MEGYIIITNNYLYDYFYLCTVPLHPKSPPFVFCAFLLGGEGRGQNLWSRTHRGRGVEQTRPIVFKVS